MKKLLVAATAAEIAPFIAQKQADTDILITGVGMVATAFALGARLNQEAYGLVINAGIAGAYNRNLALGTVVEVRSEQLADFGAEAANGNFLSAFEMGLVDGDAFPFKDGRLINSRTGTGLPKVNGLTVNLVHGEKNTIIEAEKRYRADIETMEGMAVFYACLQQGIPFIALRAISNYVEPRNRAAWEIPLAIKTLNEVLNEI